MNILFIVPYVPNLIRVRPYNLIRHLAAHGHEVTVLTLWTIERERADAEALAQQGKGEQATQLDPHNASCQVKLADLYRDAGRAEDARAAYETALTLRPDDEYVRQQLAQLP